ncbi:MULTISPECIES: hypothetical protein [unclassified Frankia]|uniref:hypothetical protein n=1 Tax=unclassified Frankia TaxID=2632575 RepID=UPI001EF661D7|nr:MULTISPECIES: hypothetical protein [unclassified Frankia]
MAERADSHRTLANASGKQAHGRRRLAGHIETGEASTSDPARAVSGGDRHHDHL